jgi:hypothetical protein
MNLYAYQGGRADALAAFKVAEWNWKMTGGQRKKDAISADNGRRAYGTQFNEPGRQNRSVGQAFDSLSATKPSDFINAGNEAMIGATA